MRRLLTIAALLLAAPVGALAQKTVSQLQTENTSTFPTGCTNCITPAAVSALISDILVSFWNIGGASGGIFVASGASHATGLVPDPGAVAGTTRFLREDATWAVPASGGTPGGATSSIQFNNAGAFGGFTMGGDVTVNTGTGVATVSASSITNSKLAGTAGNSLKGNTSSISAAPTDVAVPSCSGASSALTWTLGSGFGCNNIASGGGTPASPTSSIQFNNNGAFGAVSSIVSTNGNVTLGGSTVAANDPVLNLSQVWGTTSVAFTGIKLNVNNTSSLTTSLLMDLQTSGASRFNVSSDPFGNWLININGFIISDTSGGSGLGLGNALNSYGFGINSSNQPIIPIDSVLAFSNVGKAGNFFGTGDAGLSRASAKVIAIGAGSSGDTTGWYNYGGQARVTTDAPTVSTSLSNVTGLTVSLTTGRTYGFDVYMNVTDAAAAGVQVAMAGANGLSATAIESDGWITEANAIKGQLTTTALGAVTASSITSNTSGIVVQVRGTITVNVGGTLNVQAAQTISSGTATTIKRGSRMYVEDMP